MVAIVVDVADFGRLADALDAIRSEYPGAFASALNWTGDKARTAVARTLGKELGLSYSATRAALRITRANRHDLEYDINASGRAIPLKEFGARQTRSGVTVRAPLGGTARSRFPHAFIVQKLGGGVFQRVYQKDVAGHRHGLPIRQLFGPSVPSQLLQGEAPKAFREIAEKEFPDRLLHEISRVTSRAAFK